ncbi:MULTISPECIES: GapA-binding peptide SR1P [Thermoactinomyces]|uniref:GapA-binding peptide SR1P n=1 Tax=Thermoactinomyces daqus TaxID=1329516 RepID=A0A7W1X9G2_9BACL|nr:MULTISPECIES: GapA-binding peptide SR1P [Thermoactinomyces]MBA4542582.1 GapA-binding peptide SR1P [Thermoactinomyces daqus]MBH8598018.1 GapA-binding peptide SR1P [Thermoactinomyces sp. CICC 10523]MBH8603049.1 GapA-binding peptide SR1P [Thermoactinomyces sp. CICC 10522]MBH8609236.1 GapA-binding peptide SR1P [Thermoactinomyces sp. CICC 10521]
MEAIVCQSCDKVIEYVEAEKVGTLYSTCDGCDHREEEKTNRQ